MDDWLLLVEMVRPIFMVMYPFKKYKFDTFEDNIDLICDKIRYILENNDKLYSDFDEYRQTVLSLEKNYNIRINDIFGT